MTHDEPKAAHLVVRFIILDVVYIIGARLTFDTRFAGAWMHVDSMLKLDS